VNFNAGFAFMQLRELATALPFFEQCLKANPTFREAHIKAASILRDLNRPSEVVGHLQRAIALDPSSPGAYLYLGDTLNNLKRWGEAVETYKAAAKLVDPAWTTHREETQKKEENVAVVAAVNTATTTATTTTVNTAASPPQEGNPAPLPPEKEGKTKKMKTKKKLSEVILGLKAQALEAAAEADFKLANLLQDKVSQTSNSQTSFRTRLVRLQTRKPPSGQG
jgi:tetratricopeptide (TPR) repeat protein